MQVRHTPRSIVHALFTASVLAVAAVTLLTLNQQPTLRPSHASSIPLPQSHLVTFTAKADKTILEQLQSKAEVEVKLSAGNTQISAINQMKNGTDNKYWYAYVDGHRITGDPVNTTTQEGETVQWRFE